MWIDLVEMKDISDISILATPKKIKTPRMYGVKKSYLN